jgi:hypothetical protein
MELTEGLIEVLKSGAASMEGAPRRRFMAGIVRLLGDGSQRLAETVLGWNRRTIRKGEGELRAGVDTPDGRRDNGQAPLEKVFPTLLQDIRDIVEPFLQIDPTFRTERLYRKLTAGEVRRRLVSEKGYAEKTLPSEDSIRVRLNKLGYFPQRVRKSKPQKKSQKPTQSSAKSAP